MNQSILNQPLERFEHRVEQQFEHQFGLKIRHKLNLGNASIAPAAAERLFEARQRALARHTETAGDLSLAGIGRNFLSRGEDYWRPLIAATALIAVLVCGDYITSVQRAADLEEVDSALLADDLPINAYLDRGFDTWLNSSGQR